MDNLFFKDGQQAFKEAIAAGALTVNPADSNFAGNYMYMHSDTNGDHFKNIITRKYDVSNCKEGK